MVAARPEPATYSGQFSHRITLARIGVEPQQSRRGNAYPVQLRSSTELLGCTAATRHGRELHDGRLNEKINLRVVLYAIRTKIQLYD